MDWLPRAGTSSLQHAAPDPPLPASRSHSRVCGVTLAVGRDPRPEDSQLAKCTHCPPLEKAGCQPGHKGVCVWACPPPRHPASGLHRHHLGCQRPPRTSATGSALYAAGLAGEASCPTTRISSAVFPIRPAGRWAPDTRLGVGGWARSPSPCLSVASRGLCQPLAPSQQRPGGGCLLAPCTSQSHQPPLQVQGACSWQAVPRLGGAQGRAFRSRAWPLGPLESGGR